MVKNINITYIVNGIKSEEKLASEKNNGQSYLTSIKEGNLNFNMNTSSVFKQSMKIFEEEIDIIIREINKYILPDSKQQLEFLLKQLEYHLKYEQASVFEILTSKKKTEEEKQENETFLLLYKIINHSELNISYFEDCLKVVSIYNHVEDFFSCMLKLISFNQQKNCIKISNGNKLFLSQENLPNYPIFNFLFIHGFFNTTLIKEFFYEHDFIKQNFLEKNITYSHQFPKIGNVTANDKIFVLFELIKISANCLLDSYSCNLYKDDGINLIIPQLFKNVIIMLLKIENEADKFLGYFIFEILKKIHSSEFLELAIDVYIEKKDFIKLNCLLSDLTSSKKHNHSMSNNIIEDFIEKDLSCSVIYAEILCLLNDATQWNSNSLINKKCKMLNSKIDFHIFYYLKILQLIIKNNWDVNLSMCVINNFSLIFIELIKTKAYEKLNFDNFSNEKFNKMDVSANICSFNTFGKNDQNQNFTRYQKDFFQDPLQNSKFYIDKQDNYIQLLDIILEFFGWISSYNPDFIFSPVLLEMITIIGEIFEFSYFSDVIKNYFTSNIKKVFFLIHYLLNLKNQNRKKFKITEDYPEYLLCCSSKLINFLFLNHKQFFDEFFEQIESSKKRYQLNLIIDLLEIYKSLTIYYISYENSTLDISEEELKEDFINRFVDDKNKFNSVENNLIKDNVKLENIWTDLNIDNLNRKLKPLTHFTLLEKNNKYSEIFEDSIKILDVYINDYYEEQLKIENKNYPTNTNLSLLTNERQILKERLSSIKNSTECIENILKIELISKDLFNVYFQVNKLENENELDKNLYIGKYNTYIEKLQSLVFEVVDKYMSNKKVIFLIISKIYHSGMKKLLVEINKRILNTILIRSQDFSRTYSFEEISSIFRDLINLAINKNEKVCVLKDFSNMIIKIISKANESFLNETLEWIFYQIYLVLIDLEHENSKNPKNLEAIPEVRELKNLVTDLQKNISILKLKSYVLTGLMEILLKKFIFLNN